MKIDIFSGTFFGDGSEDLRPTGVAAVILRLIVGAGLLVWALAIWKAMDLVLS
jgi:hypothetical protein